MTHGLATITTVAAISSTPIAGRRDRHAAAVGRAGRRRRLAARRPPPGASARPATATSSAQERHGQPTTTSPIEDPAVGERPVALAHGDQGHPEHRHQEEDPAGPVDPGPVVAADGLGLAGPTGARARA